MEEMIEFEFLGTQIIAHQTAGLLYQLTKAAQVLCGLFSFD